MRQQDRFFCPRQVERLLEDLDWVRRAISVVKKRSGVHEDAIREFRLTGGGVRVGPPLTEFQGILSGVPNYHGGATPLLPTESPGD